MENQQVSTNSEKRTASLSPKNDFRFATLVDFKALNGLRTDEEGNLKKLSMQNLADMIGVDRGSLYNWMKLDGFWDLVNERRREISSGGRLTKVHETLYLKAVAGEWQHLNAWLINFDPNYRTPTQKIEHEIGDSLAEAMNIAKNRTMIDAEVIDDSSDQA